MAGRRARAGRTLDFTGFLQAVRLERVATADPDAYPFSIPALRTLDELRFDAGVTFLVGENGAGKSTLIEAIAVRAGFNAEGGTPNFHFSTRATESELHASLRLLRTTRRPRASFFLRAESFYNVATEVERLERDNHIPSTYGDVLLHEQSHGEAFMSLVAHKFRPDGLYLLDEPEAALSPQRQLSLLASIHALAHAGSQFIIATHSPILMAYPGALIYQLDATGIRPVDYEQTEHFEITRDFLNHRERYFKHLFASDDPTDAE
ncbi:MAG: AAA family ATPase [Deltaproteobacteria bacterium]|nr:AAA family ATPase [Deltaproteobacteria bacterium]